MVVSRELLTNGKSGLKELEKPEYNYDIGWNPGGAS
jgi:hypothetical protein